MARFLEDEALRLERTASLLARARAWLRDEHVLAPADSVLRRAVEAARHNARALLTDRMAERASVGVDDDQPHSPLHRIKASSSNPSVGGMKRLLAREEHSQAGFRSLIDFLILRSGRVVFQLKDHQELTGQRPVLTCDLYYLIRTTCT